MVLRCTSAAEANTHLGTCSSLRKKTTVKIPTQKKTVLFYVKPLITVAGRPRKRHTMSTPLFLVAAARLRGLGGHAQTWTHAPTWHSSQQQMLSCSASQFLWQCLESLRFPTSGIWECWSLFYCSCSAANSEQIVKDVHTVGSTNVNHICEKAWFKDSDRATHWGEHLLALGFNQSSCVFSLQK